MAGPSSLKTLNSITPLSTKPSPSPSLAASMKLKTLFHTFIFSHMYRIVRALDKAKAVLLHLFKDIGFIDLFQLRKGKKHDKQKKIFFGSFRLYYNWCSSHAMPVVDDRRYNNYDYSYTTWSSNSLISSKRFEYEVEFQDCSTELSSYLQWLEEKGHEENSNEIDRLADLFIANCHEKFKLEKQESYRRFQEMMARSV